MSVESPSDSIGAVAARQLAWLSLAMILGMTLWFSATAASAIDGEFHLAGATTAWLTMAVQGGFVVGTLVSAALNLPDLLSARRLFAAGRVIAAAANAALVGAGSAAGIIVLPPSPGRRSHGSIRRG